MVPNINSFTGPNLEFPLSGHDFSVGSGDVDSSMQTSFVMSIHDDSSIANVRPD